MNGMELLKTDFWVDDWLVRPSLNRVERQGEVYQLEPRIMRVLVCLAEQPGRVVARSHVVDTVWPDVLLEGDPLNRAISDLRKLFQDDARNPAYIETIRKVGYRLVAPVSPAHLSSDGVAEPLPAEIVVRPVVVKPNAIPVRGTAGTSIWVWWALGSISVVVALLLFNQLELPEAPPTWRSIPFSSMPGIEFDPAFSPDGSRVAFARRDPETQTVDLYVRLLEGQQAQQLTDSPGIETSPAWSPDGQYLAFIQRDGVTCGIYRVSALGGPARRMTECVGALHLEWDALGESMLYADQAESEGSYQIYQHTLASGSTKHLSSSETAIWGDGYPSRSPDGKALAFIRTHVAGLAHLMIQREGEKSVEKHLPLEQRIRGLAWLASNQVLVSSDMDGRFGLHAYNVVDGTTSWVLSGSDGVHNPVYHTPTGYLIYEEWRWEKNIWRLALDGGEQGYAAPVNISPSTRWDHSPQLSPDGTRLAFISNRSGSYEVWIVNVQTGHAEAWTAFDGPYLNVPRWSPDGQHIVVDARFGGATTVYLIPMREGVPAPIAGFESALHIAPSWSVDGKTLYIGSDKGGRWNIWAYDLASEALEQITTTGGYAAQEAPGGTLFYTKPFEAGIWTQSAEGHKRRVMADLQAADWANWQVTEEGIYYVQRDGTAFTNLSSAKADAALAFYDFSSETTTVLHRPDKPVSRFALSLTPDASALLYVQVEQVESDLMIGIRQ